MTLKTPQRKRPTRAGKKDVLLIASGDLRLSANQVCWPAQKEMEKALFEAVKDHGYRVVRAHSYQNAQKHGFIASQREGMDVFAGIDPQAPLIVAEAVWQYSHHVLPGLCTHEGPILTLANWSGTWPGLVGMLNLNGSLTKAGVKYSTLWAEDFQASHFRQKLNRWLETGKISPSNFACQASVAHQDTRQTTATWVRSRLAIENRQGNYGRLR